MLAASLLLAPCARGQEPADSLAESLDSLLEVPVSAAADFQASVTAAAKYHQNMSETASSVTIVTAVDIQRYGYRTLPDVLANLRGFYISYDRNYSYLGVRGFSRPTDYNNRILILLDGNALNEDVSGSSPVGTDLGVPLSSLQQIEIVRGPGSALYGTGAVFAVINLVTKSATHAPGGVAAVQGGSYGARGGSLQYRGPLAGGFGVSVAGSWDGSDGHDLFYPEFEQAGFSGVSHNHDWERRWGVLGSVAGNGVTLHGAYSSRTKAIPTGAYGTKLTGTPSQTRDDRGFLELRFEHEMDAARRLTARAYVNQYLFDGDFYAPGLTVTDGGRNQAVGGEANLQWDLGSNNRLTLGTEIRRDLKATFVAPRTAPYQLELNAPNTVLSAYVQDEYQIAAPISLLLGVRHDSYQITGGATSPRLAIIGRPTAMTTLKVLYGSSFRAPSLTETSIRGIGYKTDASLKPERAYTFEVVAQQRLAPRLLGSASFFVYDVDGLIDLTVDPADSLLVYRNTDDATATGFELELEGRLGSRGTGYVSYTFENARAEPVDTRLSNSPVHMVKGGGGIEIAHWLGAAIQTRYESGRETVYGTTTKPSVVTDLHLQFPARIPERTARSIDRLQLSLRLNNLFDAAWATPGGVEHLQPAIPQDGRTVSAELRYRF